MQSDRIIPAAHLSIPFSRGPVVPLSNRLPGRARDPGALLTRLGESAYRRICISRGKRIFMQTSVDNAAVPSLPASLKAQAAWVRRRALQMVHAARLGHPGGDLSAADILVTLYRGILRVDPKNPAWPERDRFIMSKGHSSGALYATLALAGFIEPSELDTYMRPLARLNGHPDRRKVPGVEASTGPLGHGLPIAVGAAIASQIDHAPWRVFVLTGDGELQEGSNWEAIMAAAQYRLDNLVLIVDRNRLQQGDATENTIALEPLADRLRAFNWAVREADGHDHQQLSALLNSVPFEAGRPSAIVAHTHKGMGVSFIKDRAEWHHRVPTDDELKAALAELAVDANGDGNERECPEQ
jgi:transketolase